eukprot:scaffold18964_cov24-Tisochrysis_lutea.AAC.3
MPRSSRSLASSIKRWADSSLCPAASKLKVVHATLADSVASSTHGHRFGGDSCPAAPNVVPSTPPCDAASCSSPFVHCATSLAVLPTALCVAVSLEKTSIRSTAKWTRAWSAASFCEASREKPSASRIMAGSCNRSDCTISLAPAPSCWLAFSALTKARRRCSTCASER